jgi:leucine-zipper of insertion element IS481
VPRQEVLLLAVEQARYESEPLIHLVMAALCREFDVSRKTGYKIFQRYKDCGLNGLTNRSRRPYRHANQLAVSDREPDRSAQAGATELARPDYRELYGSVLGTCAPLADQESAALCLSSS